MQHLDNLWKAVNLVGAVRDLAVESKTYQWDVTPPMTFFLHVEHADVTLKRHDIDIIKATTEIQAGFGWQVVTDQDDVGVYIVGKRKPLIGTIGRAKFEITVPHTVHVTLKLENCQLTLDDVNTTFDLPAQTSQAIE